jgi:hypothetical protein
VSTPANVVDGEFSQRLAEVLAVVRRRTRWFAPFALLGIVAVVASLLMLYLRAQDSLNKAVEARAFAERRELLTRANYRDLSARLERVRTAFAANNRPREAQELGVALVQADQLSGDPNLNLDTAPVNISPDYAQKLAEQPRDYTLAKKTVAFDGKVYIQFAGVLTRGQITALNGALVRAGWNVRGGSGERTPVAAGFNEIRYAGNNETAARELAAAITSTNIGAHPLTLRLVPKVEGTLEVWISH